MYCLVYHESKLFIVNMNIVCAFNIIDVMCEMHGNFIVNILYTGV